MSVTDLRLHFALVACSALFFLNGCGDAPTPTPKIVLPAETLTPTRQIVTFPTPALGWSIYSRATYQIALPDSWQEVKLQENELKDAIAAAQDSNPPLAEQLRTLLESGQYKAFLFYATEENHGRITRNVSITRWTLADTPDVQGLAKAYADALPNVVHGAKVNEVQAPLKINGIRAAAFVYDVSLVDNAGTLTTLRGVQYLYVLDAGEAYLVTVTGDAADEKNFMPLARQIATSFVGVTP
ncbi:MAG: hypothetical protein HY741_17640 [Chloroflexi bacterium]|nr:hypothetical protein [Chloroflexota bacterium]